MFRIFSANLIIFELRKNFDCPQFSTYFMNSEHTTKKSSLFLVMKVYT